MVFAGPHAGLLSRGKASESMQRWLAEGRCFATRPARERMKWGQVPLAARWGPNARRRASLQAGAL